MMDLSKLHSNSKPGALKAEWTPNEDQIETGSTCLVDRVLITRCFHLSNKAIDE